MAKQIWKPGNMIYPLPAVMVSCQREGEKPNIITVAWTGTVCTNPPMVYISVRPQRYSYDILDETGEFVINLTTKELARATDYCGVRSGRDVDKFKETGLTAVEATKVKAPLIAEAPVNIECRITEKKELGSHHMFLAEVLAVHVDEKYLDENGKFQLNKSGLIAYSHGEYLDLGKEIGTFGYSVKRIKCCIQFFLFFRGWFFRKIGIGICFVCRNIGKIQVKQGKLDGLVFINKFGSADT